jgi:hypothetical protein
MYHKKPVQVLCFSYKTYFQVFSMQLSIWINLSY